MEIKHDKAEVLKDIEYNNHTTICLEILNKWKKDSKNKELQDFILSFLETVFYTNTLQRDRFIFNETSHQHQTVKSLTSICSIPPGSLILPIYKTNSGRSSIKYICSNIWNFTLKELSKTYIEKYTLDPFWMNKTNITTFKHILKKHFLECY